MNLKTNLLILVKMLIISTISCKEVKKDIPEKSVVSEVASQPNDQIYSTLVSKNGQIVFEEYYNGKSRDSLCDVQSLTKGLISMLIGIAIDQQYIESVDEPIEKYFPKEFENLKDPNKKAITIEHLLNQTSGLAWKGYLEHGNWLTSEDPISFVLKKQLVSHPGEKCNYNSGATHLLSVIISRATGMTTLEFANQFLFSQLNINSLNWKKHNKGYYDGSGLGLEAKPIDLMKIGQLLEAKGFWNGEQIISEKWIQRLFDVKRKCSTEWGLKNSKHGYCWYKAEWRGKTIDYGMGYGGQFIILIPNQNLIIVATHEHDTPDGIEQQIRFLNKKMPYLVEKHAQ